MIELIIQLIIIVGVVNYATKYFIDRFADNINPYNFSRRDNNK